MQNALVTAPVMGAIGGCGYVLWYLVRGAREVWRAEDRSVRVLLIVLAGMTLFLMALFFSVLIKLVALYDWRDSLSV